MATAASTNAHTASAPGRGRGDDDRQDDGSQNESVDEPMPREGEPGDPTRRLA